MAEFKKPDFPFDWDVDEELKALRGYSSLPDKKDRAIPRKAAGRILIATWNIANLGAQERGDDDHRLLAEIVGWFDFVAIQEVNDDLTGLRAVQALLPKKYRVLFNDAGGNRERFAFLFDSTKFKPLEEVGELTVAAADLGDVRMADVTSRFAGFDRNPFITTFEVRGQRLTFANAHLYFGADGRAGMDRRVLEAYAVARWADLRRGSKYAFAKDVVALGDFNLPKRRPRRPRVQRARAPRARPARARDQGRRDERARRRRLRPDGDLPRPDQGRDRAGRHLRLRRRGLPRPVGRGERRRPEALLRVAAVLPERPPAAVDVAQGLTLTSASPATLHPA